MAKFIASQMPLSSLKGKRRYTEGLEKIEETGEIWKLFFLLSRRIVEFEISYEGMQCIYPFFPSLL